MKVDLYDKKILHHLDLDSRATAAKISRQVNLSKENVNYRIKRLQRDILTFRTLLNASVFGYTYYRIYIKLQSYANEARIMEFLKENSTNIRLLSGNYNLVFTTIQKTKKDLRSFLLQLGEVLEKQIQEKNICIISRTQNFTKKMLYFEGTNRKRLDHDEPGEEIDDIDKSIISYLSLKPRAPFTEIAEATHLDQNLIRYRIKRLERIGAIAGYTTILDLESLGYNIVQLDFMFNNPIIPYVLEFFNQEDVLLNSYELMGRYDLSIELCLKSDEQLRSILLRFKTKFSNDYISYDLSKIFQDKDISPFSTTEQPQVGYMA